MADIAKKTVSIYIDQASAELALEKLQAKADGFNKKAEEARKRQQQLNAEIEKSKAAAAGLDALRSQYTELEKGISKTARSLDVTTANQKKLLAENKSLSATLEGATAKQNELLVAIEKARTAGDATKRLENNYETLSRSIQETTDKLRLNEVASAAAAQRSAALSTQLQQQKTAAAALNTEVRQAASAAGAVTRLTAEEAKLQKQLTATEQALEKNAAAQKLIQTQVDSGLRPSFNQLTALVQKLDKELKNLSEDAPGYASKFAAFKSATAELEAMRTRITSVKKESDSLMSQFKGVAFGVAAGGLVQGGIEALLSAIPDRVKSTAKLSDELADIEKATGLTTAQVAALNSELGKIDTRTKTAQLRQIAIGLGQINQEASSKNIAAIDKIVVALGDEFGGDANQITNVLSILRNNLQDIKTGDYATDVEHIGNALNVLGAEGLATAPVVTDIANRIAGISQQFKVSSGDILGFAATFQELGIETERGSTAIVKLFQQIGSEPEKFAKVAGLSIKEFTDLVNNDMSAAFVKVAQGAKQAGSDNVTFSKILKQLDADGSGAGEVLSKLAANSDLLAQKQKRAGQALKESSSITEEFTKKNTTLGAELDKLGKNFSSFFSSSTLSNFFKGAVETLNKLFEKTKDVNQQLDEQKTLYSKLQTEITPLLSRYDELTKKATALGGESKLSKTEQEELKKAIAAIAGTIPSAITQFDAYGNAIGISTDKAKEYIRIQRLVLQDQHADAIQSQQSKINKLVEDRTIVVGNLNTAIRALQRTNDVASATEKQGFISENTKVLLEQYTKGVTLLQNKLHVLDDQLTGARGALKELKGEPLLDDSPKKQNSSEPDNPDKPTKKPPLTPEEQEEARKKAEEVREKARQKALKDLEAYNKKIKEQNELVEKDLDEHLAAMDAIYEKHKALQLQKLKEYPEIQSKLDEFFDSDYNVQLRKLKEFYDNKKKLYYDDLTALKQLQEIEKADFAALSNNFLSRAVNSVAGNTRSTLDRLQDDSIRDQRAKFELELERKHGKDLLDLQVGQLEAQRDAAISNAQLTANEKLLIEKQTEEQISELKLQFETQRLQLVLDFAQQAASIISGFSEISTNRENAELARDKKASDEKRKNYQRLLDSKAISQQQYNARIAELDAADETRQEALRKKQFERDKRMQLLQVAISTAQAIISTLAAKPGALDILSLGAFRAVQIGFAVATGAAQAAAIASKKYAKGGVLDGPSHSAGGMPVINPVTGNKEAEVEGGEVILSKRTVANNWDIINPLLQSSMYASGQRVQFPWQSRSYQGINYTGVNNAMRTVQRFESGGVIQPVTKSSTVTTAASIEMQQQNLAVNAAVLDALNALRRQMATPQRNYVVLQDVNDSQAQMDRIIESATASR